MTLSAVHRPLNPPFRRAPGASVRPRLLAFFVGGSVFAPLFADQKAAKNTSRRLRSVLFAEKRYKEVLRAKTAVVLIPLQAIMRRFKTASRGDRRLLCFLLVPNASFPPRSAANDSRLAKKAFKKMRTKSASAGVRRRF